jgi:DsbC/DsbD-like thiol-disulfide interchange protein
MNKTRLRSALVAYGAVGILTLVTAWILLAGSTVSADTPDPAVEAGVLADIDSIAPGGSFRIGVLLRIPKGWHVYWKYPGDAGMATQVDFALPEGWKVSSLRWPDPIEFKQPGDVVGYGYTGEVLLAATVHVPKTAKVDSHVEVGAHVRWLACKDKCVMGEAKVSLPASVGKTVSAAHGELFDRWERKTPASAPDFTLVSQKGEEISLADLRGKVVVLEQFNPDCPFVKRHHDQRKTMVDLARKYADRGVVWLAINSTHYMDRETTAKWHDRWSLPYPVLIDRDGKVGRAYSAKSTPHMYVVDPDGAIVYRGAIDDDPAGKKGDGARNYVEAALEDVLAHRPVKTASTTPYGCSVKYAK